MKPMSVKDVLQRNNRLSYSERLLYEEIVNTINLKLSTMATVDDTRNIYIYNIPSNSPIVDEIGREFSEVGWDVEVFNKNEEVILKFSVSQEARDYYTASTSH